MLRLRYFDVVRGNVTDHPEWSTSVQGTQPQRLVIGDAGAVPDMEAGPIMDSRRGE